MKANWFAVNRSIVGNHLFADKPLWGWAWLNILSATDYKTERVCLTEVYRDLSRHFTYSQWRHMVSVFVREQMLEIEKTVNLGDKAGHRQIATVLNWSKYQPEAERYDTHSRDGVSKIAQSEQQSERRANDSASAERYDVQNDEIDTSAQSEQQSERSASAERTAVSIKNSKNLKNITPPTPPERSQGEEYGANLLQTEHPEVFKLLCRVKSIAGANTPQFHQWARRVLADCREHGPEKIKPILEDLSLSWGSLNMPWKYYEKQRDDSKRSSARSKIQFGDVVYHPDYGEFVADTQALYEDAWMSPEGNYVYANTLRVVRSTHA